MIVRRTALLMVSLGWCLGERPEVLQSLELPPTPQVSEASLTSTYPGQANLSWPDGGGYSGGLAAGKFEGAGTLVYLVGDYQAKYEGNWARGRPVMELGDCTTVMVSFVELQDGNGTYYYVDGRIYKGGWTEGIQVGFWVI